MHSFDHVNVKDSGCDKVSKTAVETVSVLRDLYITRHGPVAIIGPACSEDSIFIANFLNNSLSLSIIPMFNSGTTLYLSEHAEEVPNAYGMISSADILTDTLKGIVDKEKCYWHGL